MGDFVFIAVNVFVFFKVQLAGPAAEQELLLYESAAISCENTPGQPLGSRLRRPRSQRMRAS